MEILKKLSYMLTACVFLMATACSSGSGGSETKEEPATEASTEMDSTTMEADTTVVAADSVMTEADSTASE